MKFNTRTAKPNEINAFNVLNVVHAECFSTKRYVYGTCILYGIKIHITLFSCLKCASTNDISDVVTCELIAHKT